MYFFLLSAKGVYACGNRNHWSVSRGNELSFPAQARLHEIC